MLLAGATVSDGSTIDIRLDGDRIVAIGPSLARRDEDVVDLRDHLLLPAFAEPHAHLDKAFLAERVTNPTGDLMGAILAMQDASPTFTQVDVVERAERAARLLVSNGVSVIRSHADTTSDRGLRSVEALVEVRERLRDVVDIQIVALTGWPITGLAGADNRALLAAALDAGADLVGGCPHLDDDPSGANSVFLEIAAEAGVGVDVHTDETLNPAMLSLEDLARRVVADGFAYPVTASHCVSLGVQAVDVQQRVAALVAEAGIGIVALPQTNLFLQGRDHPQSMPRAVTAVAALQRAGVDVAAGGDNLQDAFNPLGRGDPLETAGLMIATTHLLPHAALDAVTSVAHRVLRSEASDLTVGSVADLVAIPAAAVREAIAFGPPARHVWHRGVLVSGPNIPFTQCQQ
jgi:cytosine deaminase